MALLGGSSVRKKLFLASMLSSGAALAVVGAVASGRDFFELRKALVRRMLVQAEIVGANSLSALLFNDPESAESTLAALKADPRVIAAALYGEDRRLFASYRSDPLLAPLLELEGRPGELDTHRVRDGRLLVSRSVLFQGRPIGTVVLASDLVETTALMTRNAVIFGSVLIASLLLALAISSKLQSEVSRPIRRLAELARRITLEKDYSARAAAEQDGEIGALMTAFNEMLEEIRKQEGELRAAQDRLEQNVLQRTAQLRAANEELEAFSYSVSHDLRAPLRHIAGFCEMLEADCEGLSDENRALLQKISRAAARMGQLIDDLLVFSRMGRSEMQSTRVSLARLVAEVVRETQPDRAGPIEWKVGPLPVVHGDQSMLRLALVNLISNAIKYSSRSSSPTIEVGVTEEEREIIVFVRDNGVGFDMAYASKLFGVFQRLHRSDEFEGTGIGLANVRRIIQRHGGRTWAEGAVGRGAAFYFSLPKNQETSNERAQTDSVR